MQALALFVLLAYQVAADDRPAMAIAAAKQAVIEDVDPTVSSKTAFEDWLEALVGPSAEVTWEVNDCGEQTGDPATDAGRDIPLGVEARVTFPDRRVLSLSIMVGTWRTGVAGTPRFRFGILEDASGRTSPIDRLAQVSALLAGSPPPVRAGSTLWTPVVITRVDPELPEAARRISVTGPVLLEVRIDERGRVADVPRVVRGHPALHEAAEHAVRQWTFEPYIFEGRPTPIVMTVLVPFAPPSSRQAGESQTMTGVMFPDGDRVDASPVLLSWENLPLDVAHLPGLLSVDDFRFFDAMRGLRSAPAR
jgi:TonB family protein